MKISIVTVVFNGEKFLERTIKSVLEQTYHDFEYIVIDGASTDGTIEIIEKYLDHISVFISEPDFGQTDALLKGIRRCSGEYICWLNADDMFFCRDTLKELSRAINDYPGTDLFFGNDQLIDSDDEVIAERDFKNLDFKELLWWRSISQPASIFSRRAFDKFGLNENLVYSMDLDFFLKVFKSGSIKYLNTTLAKNRIHPLRKMSNFYLVALAESTEVRKIHGLNSFAATILKFLRTTKFKVFHLWLPRIIVFGSRPCQ